jgi:hypothetical protein
MKHVAHKPLHRKVLAVLACCEYSKTYRGVILPVAGENHTAEAEGWFDGSPLNEGVTNAIFGAWVEDLSNQGYYHRN